MVSIARVERETKKISQRADFFALNQLPVLFLFFFIVYPFLCSREITRRADGWDAWYFQSMDSTFDMEDQSYRFRKDKK